MAKVARLPPDLANQIAAGEVVERPSSIVKELVENALDAGATRVRVDVEGGGVALLRVSDDGSGMDEEDARLAVERHATSKLRELSDLERITTFGFRGEALPSIASVSRFCLRTRTPERDEGVEIAIVGGGAPSVKPCGTATGTTVEVRDLFFNVPARRKFLKAQATESAHVSDVVEAMALAAPAVAFTLTRDGRTVRDWVRSESAEARARASFAGEELAEIHGERGPLQVRAFLGRPERARASAASLRLFVNGRLVRDRALQRTICQAYGTVLPAGRYPVGAVFVELPVDRVDVNVHPQKAEVRFADARAVQDALFQIVSSELGRSFGFVAPSHPIFHRPNAVHAPALEGGHAEDAWIFSGTTDSIATPSPAFAAPAPSAIGVAEMPAEWPLYGDSRGTYARLRFLAQLRATYLLCEGPEGLYILDQHAAAERVTFHRLKTAFASRAVAIQPLLFPVVVDVTAEDAALVEERHEVLLSAGIDARVVGPKRVAIHGTPQILGRASPERLLRDLLAEASRAGGAAFHEAIDLALATMACHGSIRAGDRLLPDEATALLAALDGVDFGGHCPHGRPIVMTLGLAELERRVGRR